jgi:predicted nucleic acid-binding protein
VTPIVVDTSAILALFDEAYAEHPDVARIVTSNPGVLAVSPMVVAEADYMLFTRLGTAAARRFAADIADEAYELAEWSASDHAAALDVSARYGQGKDYIGMADASNVVLAERYRTTHILTLDQRHFRQLRPLHGAEYFTLLPYDGIPGSRETNTP